MGLDHPALAESDQQIAASALPDDVTLNQLVEAGWVKYSPARFTIPASDARLALADSEPPALPSRPDGHLQLLTPKPHHFLNSTFANMQRQRRAMGGPTIYVHPDDAVRLGLKDGCYVEVRNDRGQVNAQLQISDEVIPGVATLPGKWWSQDVGGAGPNGLTPASWTPGGEPAYNDTFVTITDVTGPPNAADEPVV